jgi:hypothetical protein
VLVSRQIAAVEVANESFIVVISKIINMYTSRGLRLEIPDNRMIIVSSIY